MSPDTLGGYIWTGTIKSPITPSFGTGFGWGSGSTVSPVTLGGYISSGISDNLTVFLVGTGFGWGSVSTVSPDTLGGYIWTGTIKPLITPSFGTGFGWGSGSTRLTITLDAPKNDWGTFCFKFKVSVLLFNDINVIFDKLIVFKFTYSSKAFSAIEITLVPIDIDMMLIGSILSSEYDSLFNNPFISISIKLLEISVKTLAINVLY